MSSAPEIKGITGTIKSVTIRHEIEGTWCAINLVGPYELADEISVAGIDVKLNYTVREFSGDSLDSTTLELKPDIAFNRLAFMDPESFRSQLSNLVGTDHTDKINNWVGHLSWILEGKPATDVLGLVKNAGYLADIIRSDLLKIKEPGEIGFQQAAQELFDYGLHLTPTGTINPLPKPIGDVHTDLVFIKARLDDDHIDYSKIAIRAYYTKGEDEIAVIDPPLKEGDTFEGKTVTGEAFPTEDIANLSIATQRRRLLTKGSNGSFTCLMNTELTIRSQIQWQKQIYQVTRLVHRWTDSALGVTELESYYVKDVE